LLLLLHRHPHLHRRCTWWRLQALILHWLHRHASNRLLLHWHWLRLRWHLHHALWLLLHRLHWQTTQLLLWHQYVLA
jgi:hypothetical protein